jgi:large repetitive protein
VHPGDTFAYTITVGNSGPSTILDLAVTDDLPTGLILQSVSAATPWSCNNSDPVSCSYDQPLDPGDSAPVITINVKVDPAFLGTSIVNEANVVAVVTAMTQDNPGTVSTAKDDETTPVVRSADLTIDKSVSKSSAAIGDEFDWVLDITNHGPDTATNVAIHDAIPAAFQVMTVTPTGAACTSTASSVDCTVTTLANGGTAKVVVHVKVVASAATGSTSNTATVSSDTSDPNTADNTDTAAINVTASSSQAPVPPTSGGSNGSGTPSLPRTGNGSLGAPLTLAGLMLVGGAISLVIARRRRAATAK